MKKDSLKDEANALRVQKHQLNNTDDKIDEINSTLDDIQKEQTNSDQSLDDMLKNMEQMLSNGSSDLSIMPQDDIVIVDNKSNIPLVDEIDHIKYDDTRSWEEYIQSIEDYGFKHNLDLKEDPFKHIMTKSQQVELQKRIKDDFTMKNADCDKYDYMIAGTCGAIGGLIDILFVGAPGDSMLGDVADKHAIKITEKFAEFLGWDSKAVDYEKYILKKHSQGKVPLDKDKYILQQMLIFLEKKFGINYDQTTSNGKNGTGGLVENLLMNNHHMKSLGHSPDIIGLFFSILNQFTSTSTFLSNGKLTTIDTKTFELKGNNFVAKIFCGFVNWFGHIMSDWVGSNSSIAKGNRGSGVPLPFYSLFQLMDFGRFGEKGQETFAVVASKVFENGYDFRHGMAMAIPVLTTELLIRFMWTMKSHFYHQREWKNSVPSGNIPELRRMLLVGHGTLCLMDGADAYLRSGGEIVTFLSRTNLIAWVRFGYLSLKEINAWYNSGHIDTDLVDKYLDEEYKIMLKKYGSI